MVAGEQYLLLFRFEFGHFLLGMLLELSLESRILLITRQQFKAPFLSSEREVILSRG